MTRKTAIAIRRAEPRDAEALKAIFDSPGSMAGTLQLPFPSVAMWQKRLADFPPDDVMLVAEVDSEVVGNLGLHVAAKSPRRRHAGAIGMAVRDDWHNRGVGTALLAAGIDLADNWLGYTRLELTVYTDNAAAVALYRKFGFAVEGTARGYALRDGTYVDAFMMARHVSHGAVREGERKGTKTVRKTGATRLVGHSDNF
jgi:L-phenylalanine/L-methionine N-acetyltransferase